MSGDEAVAETPRRPAWDLLVAAGLGAAALALYHQALGVWWSADDFFNLRWVHAHSPWEYAFQPAVWQSLPFRMLTPLLFVSYDADLALFGPDPRGFQAHQLVVLVLATLLLYAVLRCWLARRWAAFGAWAFLTAVPTAILAPLVMARHYLECAALAALAVLAWVGALRAGSRRPALLLAVAAAGLWLLAALAKEIAVPLVLLLPLLPAGTARRRLLLAAPLLLALLTYVGYRRWLLGVFFGGYGWAPAGDERLRQLVGLPVAIGRELVGPASLAGGIALAVLLATTLLAGLGNRRAALLVAGGVAFALLPVLPVATAMVSRYAFAAAAALAVCAAVGLAGARNLAHTVALVGAVALLVANRQAWAEELARRERSSAEYRALLTLPAGEVVRQPSGTAPSLTEVQLFGRDLLGRPAGAGWFADDLYLCLHASEIRRLWQWDGRRRDLADRTAEIAALQRRHCSRIRRDVPLAVSLERPGDTLRWDLGPYRDGRWSFVFADGVRAERIPRRGGFQLAGGPGPLRVRYDDPAGWTTYSRVLRPPEPGGKPVRWLRPVAPEQARPAAAQRPEGAGHGP